MKNNHDAKVAEMNAAKAKIISEAHTAYQAALRRCDIDEWDGFEVSQINAKVLRRLGGW